MNYGKKRLYLLIFLLSLSSLFFLSQKAYAQNEAPNNYDVTVSPVFLDLSADPEDIINTKIRIRNNTTSALPIKLEVKKMTGDTNGSLTLRDTSNDGSLSWITFENEKLEIKPLEWTDVPFTISIPKDAAFGYYFAISFTQDSETALKRTGTAITGAVVVPILLEVRKEGAKSDIKIAEFSVGKFFTEFLPVDFNVLLENTGNIHVLPRGNIFIKNASGAQIAELDINPGAGNIIPSTKRAFSQSFTDGFFVYAPSMDNGRPKLDKNGNQTYSLQINWNKLTSFRLGKYTANLTVVYDNGTRDMVLEKTISFWVIPYKALLIILLVLVIIIIALRIIIKSYISREVKKRLKD